MKKKKQKTKKYFIEIDELKFNDAIMINYRHELLELKREMVREYNKSIIDIYRNHLGYIVKDDNVVKQLQNKINQLGEKWFFKFFNLSEPLSNKTVKSIDKHNDKRFEKITKENPFLLQGTEEREATTKIIESSIAENVGLIKSIPKKYHDDILGDVMRTVGKGGNLQELAQALAKRSNITSKRINLIARDQTAKATALLDQQKAIELGFDTAKWQKSIAGKTHRKDHAAAHNEEFSLKKGCLISGEYILPRMKINCKCSYKLVM